MQIKAVARVLHTTKQMSSYIGTWAWLRHLTTIHVMCKQTKGQEPPKGQTTKRAEGQKDKRPKGQKTKRTTRSSHRLTHLKYPYKSSYKTNCVKISRNGVKMGR